jgi:predicted DNA-binding transcriptional regulator AlpA
MNKKEMASTARELPPGLAELALIDIAQVCKACGMSPSWVHQKVSVGEFPAPLRFSSRCARWRAADVREWLLQRPSQAGAADVLRDRAKRASDAAQSARAVRAASLAAVL